MLQGTVAVPVAGTRVDDQAAHEIDDRDELERRHGGSPARSGDRSTALRQHATAALITGLDLGGAHLKAAQVTAAGQVDRGPPAALRPVAGPGSPGARPGRGGGRAGAADARRGHHDRRAGRPVPGPQRRRRPAAGDACAPPGPAASSPSGPAAGASSHSPTPPHCSAEIASANWLATATLAARRAGDGLLVDLGSTTTDLLVLAGGAVHAAGHTDRERLATGELVYLGLTRTPVMALAAEVPFAGRPVALMNELFATSADLWRLLDLLPEAADQHPAADGGAKTADGQRPPAGADDRRRSRRRTRPRTGAGSRPSSPAASSAASRTPWPCSSRAASCPRAHP